MADDDSGEGPVVVKRAAYDAGMKLEAEEKAGKGTAFTIRRGQSNGVPGGGRYCRGDVLDRGLSIHDDPRVRRRRNGNHHS